MPQHFPLGISGIGTPKHITPDPPVPLEFPVSSLDPRSIFTKPITNHQIDTNHHVN
jgi:hypothetical protein